VDVGRVAGLLGGLGGWTPLLLLPSFLAVLLESHAWQLGLSLAGYRTRLATLWGVRVGSESMGAVLPLGAVWADAMKPSLLASRCGIPLPGGLAAIAIRKYLLVLSQAAYLGLSFVVGHRALRDGFAHATGMPALSFVALVAACVLALVATAMAGFLGRGSSFQSLVDWLSRARIGFVTRRLARLRLGATSTDDAAAAFFRTRAGDRARPLALCLGAWLLEATETWLVLRALGALLGWGDAVGVEALVVLSRHLLPFLPGGLGVQELGYTALLAGVGCDVERALSLVVLKRAREAVWVLVGALALSGGTLRRSPSRVAATA
jgi:uncharacterized membrane protein YbhN (UPF0104 family)